MKLDYDKIQIISYKLGPNDTFKVDENNHHTKFFISGKKVNEVWMIYYTEDCSHDDLAETYVMADGDLCSKFGDFEKEEGNHSYKDFLILKRGAIAIFDKKEYMGNSKPKVVCSKENKVESMNKVLGAYLDDSKYKLEEVCSQSEKEDIFRNFRNFSD